MRANESRIAFAVGSRDGVERAAGYETIFFADPSGNRLEVYHRPA